MLCCLRGGFLKVIFRSATASLIALSQRIMVEAKTKTTRHAVNQGLDPQIAVALDRDLQVTFTNCQRIKESQKSSNGL